MAAKMRNAVIFVGNTGVGKSFICNKLFELCGSSISRFQSNSSAKSVTQVLQSGQVTYNGGTYTLLDAPGFFDTNGVGKDGENACKLVKALESCEEICALVFVFTDRFSTPQRLWFERMCAILNGQNAGHIILLQNKQDEYSSEGYTRNSLEIQQMLGGQRMREYIWLDAKPPGEQIAKLMDTLVKNVPFKLENLVVPEVCYEREERGPEYEEIVGNTTKDEGRMVDQVKDTSHYVTRNVWDRSTLQGLFGTRLPGAKKEVQEWVKSETVEKTWVPKIVVRKTIKTSQNVYKVRFDGTKDFQRKVQLKSRAEVF